MHTSNKMSNTCRNKTLYRRRPQTNQLATYGPHEHDGYFEGVEPHIGKGDNTINSDTLVTPRAQRYLVTPRLQGPTWAEGGTR